MDVRTKERFMTLNYEFKKKFGNDLKENINLSNYSWFNLGGNAEFFYKAKNNKQLLDNYQYKIQKAYQNIYQKICVQ